MTQGDLIFSPQTPLLHGDTLFLTEETQSYTGAQLLSLAGRVDELAPAGAHAVIAVSSPSPALILATAMAAWARGATPLILDPNLKGEPTAVLERHPGLPVMVDRPQPSLGNAIVVDGTAAAPLAATWPDEHQTIAQFFTSGSTGEPKLVSKRAFQFFRQMGSELPWLGVPRGASVFAMVPPFHILGFIYGLAMPLLTRGSTTFLHGAAPAAWIHHLTRSRPQVVVGVPSHYRFLLSCLEEALPATLYLSSGGPLTPDIDQKFSHHSGSPIVQIYGSTETGGVAARRGFGAWSPLPGLQWKVRREDGRLMVSSPWQERPDAWTVTDDLAEPAAAGFDLKGRADSIVKIGGKRFSTNEVLQVVETIPGIAATVTVSYERFGENAVALFVSPLPGQQLTEAGVRAQLALQLAPFKVPRSIRILAELPLLGNGKVDRRRLGEMARDADAGGSATQSSEAEREG